MKIDVIDENNWDFMEYFHQNLKAMITLGADPNIPGLIYCVTVLDTDHQERMQKTYDSLADAIKTLNEKFFLWQLRTRGQISDGSGCSSCVAH